MIAKQKNRLKKYFSWTNKSFFLIILFLLNFNAQDVKAENCGSLYTYWGIGPDAVTDYIDLCSVELNTTDIEDDFDFAPFDSGYQAYDANQDGISGSGVKNYNQILWGGATNCNQYLQINTKNCDKSITGNCAFVIIRTKPKTTKNNGGFSVIPMATIRYPNGQILHKPLLINGGAGGYSFSNCIATPPVNGQCGSDNGKTLTTYPQNLCQFGSASTISGTGPWNWTCSGINGGSNQNCSTNTPLPSVNGQCGNSNGQTFTTKPTTNLCNKGNASTVSGSGPWSWACNGLNGGSNQNCSTNLPPSPVNGECGTDHTQTVAIYPLNLCKFGSSSAITGTGPWNWSCNGLFGGTNQNCYANPTSASPINGLCGNDNGLNLISTPTNLCNAGNPSALSGAGPWIWSCQGINGGINTNCSANKVTPSTSINGLCGNDNGLNLISTPTNLCNAGNPASLSETGPWNWSCQGINGGTNANCSANLNGGGGSLNAPFYIDSNLSSLYWKANTDYKITVTYEDPDNNLQSIYTLNYNFTDSDTKGLFAWDQNNYKYTAEQMTCTGGGFASKNSNAGFGSQFIQLKNCEKSQSGLQTTIIFTVSLNANYPDGNNKIGYKAIDTTGNTSLNNPLSNWSNNDFYDQYMSDHTPPTVTWNPSSPTWTNLPQVFDATCTDLGSGCTQPTGTCIVSVHGNTCHLTFTDQAGNQTISTSPPAQIDTTGPSCLLSGATGPAGQYLIGDTVHITCSDPSGCASSNPSDIAITDIDQIIPPLIVSDNLGNTTNCNPAYVYQPYLEIRGLSQYSLPSNLRSEISNLIQSNISDITRNQSPLPGGNLTTPNFNLKNNSVAFYEGNVTLENPNGSILIQGKKTLIIQNGNLTINSNLIYDTNDPQSVLGILVLDGNVTIGENVNTLNAVLFSGKSLISANQMSLNQLFWKGSVISDNTVGGYVQSPQTCPLWVSSCSSSNARKYDLNYFRYYYQGSGGTHSDPSGRHTSFIIEYDSTVQQSIPYGFEDPRNLFFQEVVR